MNLLHLLSPKGRIGRREYFLTGAGLALALILVFVLAVFVFRKRTVDFALTGLLLLSVPWLCMGLRRAHDIGRSSGWFLWRCLVSVACFIVCGCCLLLWFAFSKGMSGATFVLWPVALVAFAVMLLTGSRLSYALARTPSVEGPNEHGAPHSGSVSPR